MNQALIKESQVTDSDVTGLTGDVSGLTGNVDDCGLTVENRCHGLCLTDLIK